MSMRFWTAYAFLTLGFTKAYAASGAAGHGSMSDLLAPAVNLGILLGVLIWKLKGPLHNHFASKSSDIANTLERANLKSKEAKIMLENEEQKKANLSNEIKSINQQAENDVISFEKKISQETEEKTHKLKSDANMKIQADKKAMMDDLNAELLNQVIAKTKTTIKTNKDYQNKVSTKLLQGL
jgi:F0F1-type ATP synthase membrane subunit b/b'